MKQLGYVIANEREEYLEKYVETPGSVVKGWTPNPGASRRFPTRKRADDIAKRIDNHRCWVVALHENASRYAVVFEGEDPPPWY
jgi:hypothetical protein